MLFRCCIPDCDPVPPSNSSSFLIDDETAHSMKINILNNIAMDEQLAPGSREYYDKVRQVDDSFTAEQISRLMMADNRVTQETILSGAPLSLEQIKSAADDFGLGTFVKNCWLKQKLKGMQAAMGREGLALALDEHFDDDFETTTFDNIKEIWLACRDGWLHFAVTRSAIVVGTPEYDEMKRLLDSNEKNQCYVRAELMVRTFKDRDPASIAHECEFSEELQSIWVASRVRHADEKVELEKLASSLDHYFIHAQKPVYSQWWAAKKHWRVCRDMVWGSMGLQSQEPTEADDSSVRAIPGTPETLEFQE